MRLHKFFADGEPQTEAIDRSGFGQSVKLLKDLIEMFCRYASPSINHQHLQVTVDNLTAEIDRRLRRRELDSIAEQVDQDLRDQIEIHRHPWQI